MVTTIGVVGPSDLVTSSSRIVGALRGVEVVPLRYRRETDTTTTQYGYFGSTRLPNDRLGAGALWASLHHEP